MAMYMVQACYSPQAIAAMVKNPQDRATVLRPVVERMGGKLHGAWISLGEYDVVVLAEMPDQVSAAAIAAAVGSTGAMSKYHTTPLLTTEESIKAFSMASGVGYKPPA